MRVMIIGASRDRSKFGNRALRAYLRQGHEVLPVHPSADNIEGIPAYPDVSAPPGPVDRATLYIPADVGLEAVEQLAARGDVGELWVNPGAESDELLDRARELGFEPITACAVLDIGERP